MNENNTIRNDEISIDIKRLFHAVWSRKWLILTVSVLCAIVVWTVTFFFVTPTYEASAMFYVNNMNQTNSSQNGLSSSDIAASKNLVESYIIILRTKESLTSVIEYAGIDLHYETLSDMITAEAVDETEILNVIVTSDDPEEAAKLANAIIAVLPGRITSIIEGTSAKSIDNMVDVPKEPSSPSYLMNAIIGFIAGFVLIVAIVVLREVFDVTIRTEEDIAQFCRYPVLSSVPDMYAVSKGDHGRKRKTAFAGAIETKVFGSDISFAASEAYKLLRTKLQFSFAGENNCRVICVSSSLSGEGKSLSSINLAYTLAQMNKKVMLIDCDMRRPTIAEKLKIQRKPGLSDYLSGQSALTGLIQHYSIKGSENVFSVITAGQNPPNPIELLGSERMANMLQKMRQVYDYVILDLPPVGEVSDAMAVAKETDGVLLVVRNNYCSRMALNDTVQQFEFIGAKILGIVCNCATESVGQYGKYGKYGKGYYNRYYGRERSAET